MKICFISDSKSVHCKRWTEAMAGLGHEVHLVCNHPADFSGVNVHVRQMYPAGKKGIRRIIFGMLNVHKTRKLIRNMKPDVVHLLGLFPLLAPDLKHIVRGLPNLVVSGWGSELAGAGQAETISEIRTKKFIFNCARKITATGKTLSEMTAKYTAKPVTIIPYGVELEKFKPGIFPARSGKRIVIGFLKHLEKIYGAEHLLRAFRLIAGKYDNVELLVTGGGSQLSALEQLAAELRITPLVKFTGNVPYEEVPGWLSKMDIYVMPSLYESFGVSALEASAMELPVVASNAGGIPEVVLDGKTGILVPPANHMMLADAIDKLILNPELRSEFGKAGREFVRENFIWENNVEKMIRVYETAMRN